MNEITIPFPKEVADAFKKEGALIALGQMIHLAESEGKTTIDVETLRFAYKQWEKGK